MRIYTYRSEGKKQSKERAGRREVRTHKARANVDSIRRSHFGAIDNNRLGDSDRIDRRIQSQLYQL